MSYTHMNCAVGERMDFGSIGVGGVTSELETYQVQEVSFGVAVSTLDAQAAFQLEGRIGGSWFALPSTLINITPPENPATAKGHRSANLQSLRKHRGNPL